MILWERNNWMPPDGSIKHGQLHILSKFSDDVQSKNKDDDRVKKSTEKINSATINFQTTESIVLWAKWHKWWVSDLDSKLLQRLILTYLMVSQLNTITSSQYLKKW